MHVKKIGSASNTLFKLKYTMHNVANFIKNFTLNRGNNGDRHYESRARLRHEQNNLRSPIPRCATNWNLPSKLNNFDCLRGGTWSAQKHKHRLPHRTRHDQHIWETCWGHTYGPAQRTQCNTPGHSVLIRLRVTGKMFPLNLIWLCYPSMPQVCKNGTTLMPPDVGARILMPCHMNPYFQIKQPQAWEATLCRRQ